MNSQDEFELWERLFTTVNTSPARHPVNQWRYTHPHAGREYGAIDVWPILKMMVLLRGCHYFHADAEHVLTPTSIAHDPEVRLSVPRAPLGAILPRSLQNLYVNLGRRFHHQARIEAAPHTPPKSFVRSWPDYHADVLMFGTTTCNYRLGDCLTQLHIDPLRLALEEAGLHTATLLTDVQAGDAALEAALLGGTFGFKDELQQALHGLPPPLVFDLAELPGYADWYEEVAAVYPIDRLLTRKMVSDQLRRTFTVYMSFYEFFRLRRIKAVFLYAFYGTVGYAAAAAGKALGIPVADIQHGVAGAGHESYHWPDMPTAGYNTLPSDFLLWSDADGACVRNFAGPGGPLTTTIGHSWRLLDSALRDRQDTVAVDSARFSAAQENYAGTDTDSGPTTDRLRILLTLRNNEDITWLEPLLDDLPPAWHLMIRLHPAELRDPSRLQQRKAVLQRAGVEVERPSSLPMPVILGHSDVHVTQYSSAVLDARAFGVPSVCYSLSANWFYAEEKRSFVTVVVQEHAALRAAISAIAEAGATRLEPPDCLDPAALTRTLTAIVERGTGAAAAA